MPIRESYCPAEICKLHLIAVEHYYHNDQVPLNPCESCGGETRLIEFSRTHVVFTGVISARYNDRTKEGAHQEGHTVWERDPETKKCTPVWIETFQQQREYCKRNKLANPSEMSNNYAVAEDGKKVLNTCGMPGTEI